jgi:hypothetical protein
MRDEFSPQPHTYFSSNRYNTVLLNMSRLSKYIFIIIIDLDTLCISPMRTTCPTHLILLDLVTLITVGRGVKLKTMNKCQTSIKRKNLIFKRLYMFRSLLGTTRRKASFIMETIYTCVTCLKRIFPIRNQDRLIYQCTSN